MKKIICSFVLILFSLTLSQTTIAATDLNQNHYQVEMIFFKYNNVDITENLLPDEATCTLSPNTSDQATSNPGLQITNQDGQSITPLPSSDFFLTNAANRLSRDGRYTILFHTAFIKYIHAPAHAKRLYFTASDMDLGANSSSPWQLQGTIKLSKSFYINLAANLTLCEQTNSGIVSTTLDQLRKLKTKELHYLDNPAFGVLVEIRPVKNSS